MRDADSKTQPVRQHRNRQPAVHRKQRLICLRGTLATGSISIILAYVLPVDPKAPSPCGYSTNQDTTQRSNEMTSSRYDIPFSQESRGSSATGSRPRRHWDTRRSLGRRLATLRWALDLFPAVGLVIEQDVAATPPDLGADTGKRHRRRDDLFLLAQTHGQGSAE